VSGAPGGILYISQYYSEEIRRALRLTYEFSPGGMNKILPMARLLARNHPLTMLSTGYAKSGDLRWIPRREEELAVGGRPVRVIYPGYLAVRYFSFLEIVLACGRECLRRKPDIVMFYNFRLETLFPALIAKLFGGAKIVCQFEDGLHVLFRPGSVRRLVFRALHVIGKRWSDGFTLVNGGSRSEFPETSSVVIPFVLSDDARAAARPQLHRFKDAPVVRVAYSGTLDGERGADVFLEAAWRLRQNPRLRFFVSGRGPLLDRVLERAGRRENLTYAGLLDAAEVEAHLRDMDILVNPQKLSHPFARYSFPSKVMRYILLNKPIVSTAFPDISEVPAPGLVFYRNDDPGDLAGVLAGLAEQDVDVDYRALFEKFSEAESRAAVTALLERVGGLRRDRPVGRR
jgi:glycosyltransferase involved in cell wall biosynthesis